eukprot:9492444-Pyramimonas_sp.AAC.1
MPELLGAALGAPRPPQERPKGAPRGPKMRQPLRTASGPTQDGSLACLDNMQCETNAQQKLGEELGSMSGRSQEDPKTARRGRKISP